MLKKHPNLLILSGLRHQKAAEVVSLYKLYHFHEHITFKCTPYPSSFRVFINAHSNTFLIMQLCLFTTILTDEFNRLLRLPANLIALFNCLVIQVFRAALVAVVCYFSVLHSQNNTCYFNCYNTCYIQV